MPASLPRIIYGIGKGFSPSGCNLFLGRDQTAREVRPLKNGDMDTWKACGGFVGDVY